MVIFVITIDSNLKKKITTIEAFIDLSSTNIQNYQTYKSKLTKLPKHSLLLFDFSSKISYQPIRFNIYSLDNGFGFQTSQTNYKHSLLCFIQF